MNDTPHWCESIKIMNVLCLRRATTFLDVKIGEDDDALKHGFCDYHAGVIAIMVVSDEKVSEE